MTKRGRRGRAGDEKEAMQTLACAGLRRAEPHRSAVRALHHSHGPAGRCPSYSLTQLSLLELSDC